MLQFWRIATYLCSEPDFSGGVMVGVVRLKVQQSELLFRLALMLMAFAGIGGILLASLCAADTERAKAETVSLVRGAK
jgi:hypothetical protein